MYRFIYAVIRLLYYLPMERMTEELLATIEQLKEENKKLRELKCVPSNLKTAIRIDKENERLEKENKNLKEEIWKLGLHIKAKDEAYIKLLRDYEELKESSETKEETLIKAIGDIFNKLKN